MKAMVFYLEDVKGCKKTSIYTGSFSGILLEFEGRNFYCYYAGVKLVEVVDPECPDKEITEPKDLYIALENIRKYQHRHLFRSAE